MQGATSEKTGEYVSEEQRRRAGCSAGRMPSYFAVGPLGVLSSWPTDGPPVRAKHDIDYDTDSMAPNRPLTLAVVDDDDDVRRALSRLLRAMGHEVKVFSSAEDFEAETDSVDCVIVDVRLPGLSGLELRERLRQRIEPTAVVLITGDGDRLTADGPPAVDTPLVTKPFDDATLTAAISDAISMADSLRGRNAS